MTTKILFYYYYTQVVDVGEILALTRADVDYTNKVIHINKTLARDKYDRPILSNSPKTKAGIRDIPMNEEMEKIFRRNTNFKYLFTLPDGRFIATSTINSHFKKICKDAGIREYIYEIKRNGKTIRLKSSNVTTHMLRHTFITRCAEEGMNQKALQMIAGHSDYRITSEVYTNIDETFKNDELLKTQEKLRASNLI